MMRRVAVLAILLAVSGLALALGGEGPDRVKPFKDTDCYPCHVNWSPPLRSFIAPNVEGEGVQLPATGTIDAPILVTQAWHSDAEITELQATLDLSKAPSLNPVKTVDDFDDVYPGTVLVDPATANENQTAFVTVLVPQGLTYLSIELTPDNPDPNLGPDFGLWIYPGADAPSGEPAKRIDENGRGEAESFLLEEGVAFADYGYGNWSLQVHWDARKAGGSLPVQFVSPELPFRIHVIGKQDVSGERLLIRSYPDLMVNGQSQVVRMPLEVVAAPAAGETVTLILNATDHYIHDSSNPQDDWENSTEVYVFDVVANDKGVLLQPPAGSRQLAVNLVAPLTLDRISEVVGYVSAFLLLASIVSGGMFGKANRRMFNTLFGTARRRVAYHNVLSYLIILAAIVHAVIFVVDPWEAHWHWGWGLIWGGLSILCMFGLGVTGAIQVPMVRRWNYPVWRWSHFYLTIGTIVFTLLHIFLDGANWPDVAESVGWRQPFVPDNLQAAN